MRPGGSHGQSLNPGSDPDDSSFHDTSSSSATILTPTQHYSVAGVIRSIFHAVLVQDVEHLNHVLTSLSLDPNRVKDREGKTMLMVAAVENKYEVLRYLLTLPSIDLDLQNEEGETALYQAAAAGSNECVQLLLLAGASSNQGNEESITPLIIASYNGFVSICRNLITIGHANVNQQDNTQKSALLLASYAGHVDVMAELVSHGAALNMLDQYGWSSLMLAAYAGKKEACKLLLAHGADPHIRTANGKTAFSLSWDSGHRSISNYISKFVSRNTGSLSSSGTGSGSGVGMPSRAMLQQMLPQAPKSPSRKTHSPAPSLPSVPEEGVEESHFETQRSFSAQNSTISRPSILPPRLSLRRPHPIPTTSIQVKSSEEEPVSPIPTTLIPSHLVTIFNNSNNTTTSSNTSTPDNINTNNINTTATTTTNTTTKTTTTTNNTNTTTYNNNNNNNNASGIDNIEESANNEGSSSAASINRERTKSAPTLLPTKIPTTIRSDNGKLTQSITVVPQKSKLIQTHKVSRKGIIPRYGSRNLRFSRDDQPGTTIPQVHSHERHGISLSERNKENDMEASLNRRTLRHQRLAERPRSQFWVYITLVLTSCFIPRFFPKAWTKNKCQDWREKVSLGILAIILSLALGLLLLGLPIMTCTPYYVQNLSMSTFNSIYGSMRTSPSGLMVIRGSVYDVREIFADGRHPSIAGNGLDQSSLDSFLSAHYGSDVSSLFLPSNPAITCNLFGATSNFGKCVLGGSGFNHCHPIQLSQTLLDEISRKDIMIKFQWTDIQSSVEQGRSVFIYDGAVFDATDYLAQSSNVSMSTLEKARMSWIRSLVGKDATLNVQRQPDHQEIVTCFQAFFKVGALSGQTAGCSISIVINIMILAILIIITAMRVISALIYHSVFTDSYIENEKQSSNPNSSTGSYSNSNVLMLVTCQASDSEDAIKATLDSLVQTDYDDNQKMLMVITDTTFDNLGDPSQAMKSCMKLMDLASNEQPEKLKGFVDDLVIESQTGPISIGGIQRTSEISTVDGTRVFSGYYFASSRRVPYILVSRPPHTSVFQKKKMVIRWLYRVCFNKPISTLEFTLSEKVRNLNHQGPGLYDLLLMSEIGSVCDRRSVSHMVDTLEREKRLLGVSGRCIIRNRSQNWVTRIQDYENHLSQQFTLPFESSLGVVQCLPGHFSMVRIKIKQAVEGPMPNKAVTRRHSFNASIISTSEEAAEDNSRFDEEMKAGTDVDLDSGSIKNTAGRCNATRENEVQYCIPILVHPEVALSLVGHKSQTWHERVMVQDKSETRYMTWLLHRTFPDYHIKHLPNAIYSAHVTPRYWVYVEEQRKILINSVHSNWVYMWSPELRGIFCCSINFLAFLRWLKSILSPVLSTLAWAAFFIVIVAAATNTGDLHPYLTMSGLILYLAMAVVLPIIGIFLGRRGLLLNIAGFLLYLTASSFKSFAIAVRIFSFSDDNDSSEDSVLGNSKTEEDSFANRLTNEISIGSQRETNLDDSMTLRYWAEWIALSQLDSMGTLRREQKE